MSNTKPTKSKQASELDPTEARRAKIEARAKKFGLGAHNLLVGSDKRRIKYYPTGLKEIDNLIPGIPGGMITELCGESQTGKTYVAFLTSKEAQKEGGRILYVAAEWGNVLERATQLGVSNDPNLWEVLTPPFTAEQAANYILECITSNEYAIIILDSITSLVPQEESDKSLDDKQKVAGHAAFINRFLRKAANDLAITDTAFIIVNQFRMGAGFRPNELIEKPTGGFAVEYWSRVRLHMHRKVGTSGKILNASGEQIGGITKAHLQKSNIGGQDARFEFPVMFVDADRDITGEFLIKGMANREIEPLLKQRTDRANKLKYYQWIDCDTGEVVLEESDKNIFVLALLDVPAPSIKKKNDKSTNAFEFICGRLKINDEQAQAILDVATDPESAKSITVADSTEETDNDPGGYTLPDD